MKIFILSGCFPVYHPTDNFHVGNVMLYKLEANFNFKIYTG